MGTIKSHNIFTTLFCVVMDLNVMEYFYFFMIGNIVKF